MIEELTKRLNEQINDFTNGDGGVQNLDQAIQTAYEITEKLIVLRYKAYETGLFSSSEEIPERQEFDLDLSSMDEPAASTSQLELPTTLPESTDPTLDSEESTPTDAAVNTGAESTLTIHENEDVTEEHVQIIPVQEGINAGTPETPLHELFSAEGPLTPFDLMALISSSQGKHEKIDAFNGNYSLKEKINFINSLFGGSSESFGTTVKQIDAYSRLEDVLPTLEFLALTFEWQKADPQTLNKFMEKLVAKYA